MLKAAIIYDLDNTVYDVPTVGDQLFAPLFALLAASDLPAAELPLIRQAIMRQPFQVVAARYQFSPALTRQGSELLQALEYAGPLAPYPDWVAVRQLPGQRYLVTTGYTRLQQSKIRALGVAADFTEIHIVDPTVTSRTKRDVFAEIMHRQGYQPAEVLVVGDDPESELRAARELGIDSVLYDPYARHPAGLATSTIHHFSELAPCFFSPLPL